MSVPFWQHGQSADQRHAAALDAEVHSRTDLTLGIGSAPATPAPDALSKLLAVLDKIDRRLEAPHKPLPQVRALGLLAGGTVAQQMNLPPGSAWSLDSIIVAQRPGATGTFVLTFTGLLALDFALQSDPSGLQSKALGIPVQQSAMVSVSESGAGTTGGVSVTLVFVPL